VKPMPDKKRDLTKFDFYPMRFIYSETVQQMTCEEVGQYLLLLIHAWLGGKAASLPNNPTLLAKFARCEKVSDLVMSKWELKDDGRLYNEMLSDEWAATVLRFAESDAKYQTAVDSGRQGGLAGGKSTSEAKAAAARRNGAKGGRPAEPETERPHLAEPNGEPKPTMPLHTIANPMHTMPSQPTIALHCAAAPATAAGLMQRSNNATAIAEASAMALAGEKARRRPTGRIFDDVDDMDFAVDFGTPVTEGPAVKLAKLFYETLPEENQNSAPAPWEKLWTADFEELLKFHPREEIEMVIKTLPRSKSRQYIVRAAMFCEKYSRLLQDARKINKVKKSTRDDLVKVKEVEVDEL
jgi:uncharacterized protein YdaU (DUF1376 family)